MTRHTWRAARRRLVSSVLYLRGIRSISIGALATLARTPADDLPTLVDPWYHDFAILGVNTRQRAGMYAANQAAKQPHIFRHVDAALAHVRSGQTAAHGIELFCADGFYAHYALARGAATMHGIDLDVGELEKARLMTKLLGHEGRATFERRDVCSLAGAYDFGVCAGGLYHLANPEDLLRHLRRHVRQCLVLQTVYSMARTSPDYFESPAPGWSWGCRFSYGYLMRMVTRTGWAVADAASGELPGNDRPEDRGSAYLFCVPVAGQGGR